MVKTKVGYTGGSTKFPTYYNLTDHTETLQMEYDPSKTNYSNLLDIFWANHDPTAKLKAQYMSAIFYHDEEQKQLAEETMKAKQKKTARAIQTKILPAKTFYDAEGYHQKYLLRRHRIIFNSLGLSEAQVISSTVAARLNGYLNGHGDMKSLKQEIYNWNLNEKQNDAIISAVENFQCVGGSCSIR